MPTVVSYTTFSLFVANYPMISSYAAVSSETMAYFFHNAEARINAKIVKQYTLPFDSVPPLLQAITNEIAAYKFLSQHVFTGQTKNESSWPDRFKEAMDLLDEIAKGAIPLVDSSGGIIAARTDAMEVWSNTKDYLPTMTEDTEELQIADPDKIDDIRDDREYYNT